MVKHLITPYNWYLTTPKLVINRLMIAAWGPTFWPNQASNVWSYHPRTRGQHATPCCDVRNSVTHALSCQFALVNGLPRKEQQKGPEMAKSSVNGAWWISESLPFLEKPRHPNSRTTDGNLPGKCTPSSSDKCTYLHLHMQMCVQVYIHIYIIFNKFI